MMNGRHFPLSAVFHVRERGPSGVQELSRLETLTRLDLSQRHDAAISARWRPRAFASLRKIL